MSDQLNEEGYGHHAPGYDPRGPDFDAPHTPEREARMLAKAALEADPVKPCPACGGFHEREDHSPE